jgi:hypothetical protein
MNEKSVLCLIMTIIEVLEELYPLQAEHKHLDFGTRWQQVVDRSVSRVRVQSDRMEQVTGKVGDT